ncbi:ribosome biogenesis protein [Plasmopara halstedii]|uniref:Ribosome biogenesis protein n=1 Tax=Plasmopara halstedii TaxID=4781 RepID=A0A0P1AC07_PLAHL|nr:ribosome biogenesis protein [Plasmopara halstedii]CEG37938.1 ribosome biogenesis protein [Plasmopara halstedii]|eukprot:XP_024574307.1 ribosome biogenesis protein [Plasmopara halstedii]
MSASKDDVKRRQVIVILEQAALETVKTSKGYQLLNCDDHKGIHRKLEREASESRPDILHQELMALLDSPLNKTGYLKIYIRSTKGILIEVSSQMRVPRTYKRFAGLMVQLLHTLKIRSSDGNHTLLSVIKNPVTKYLPANSKKYALSRTGTLVNPWEWVETLPKDEPVVFIIGAMAHGHISKENTNYLDETISISEYPMSGAQAICRLLNSFERHWGIL